MTREKQSTRGKTSQSRIDNQETQSTSDSRSGNWSWAILVEAECSHHCPKSALGIIPQSSRYWENPQNSTIFEDKRERLAQTLQLAHLANEKILRCIRMNFIQLQQKDGPNNSNCLDVSTNAPTVNIILASGHVLWNLTPQTKIDTYYEILE